MRSTNFDVMRLGAALAVLVSHSVPLSFGGNDRELFWKLSRNQATLGDVAVAVFFVLSGYLICRSWLNRPEFVRFATARALRLLPALAVMLLVTTFGLGALLSPLSAREYLTDPQVLHYVWRNLSLTGFVPGLPGVFATNPFPGVLNGSLWTLPLEAACYGLIAGLGLAGLLNRWMLLALWAAGCVASFAWWGGPLVQFGTEFLGGAVLLTWRVPMRSSLAWGCLALVGLAFCTAGLRVALPSVGAYLILYLVHAEWPVRFKLSSDLSYGVYLWAFPVQQVVTQMLGAAASPGLNIVLSAPVVLGLAWLSWHGVERPASSLWTRTRLFRGQRSFDAGQHAV